MEDLLARGMLSAPLAIFLNACLRARLNIVVAGAPGSGKTTLLGALLGFIPEQERAVIIEHRAELAPTLKNRVLLEALDTGGRQGPSARQLMALALEMRPDRLVLGECRGAEAFDLLQAICTGLDGCLMTIHALSPHDLTQRLELMAALAGHALARSSIAQMIGSSFQVMVQTERVGDGSRKVTKAVALEALADGTIHFSDIFTFDAAAEGGKGRHRATGVRPWFGERLERSGVPLPPRLYES
jgi:pilus assembly protein CpaF